MGRREEGDGGGSVGVGSPFFPEWSHIGRAESIGVHGVEIANDCTNFGGGSEGLSFVTHATKNRCHGNRLESAGCVDGGGLAKIGLEVGHDTGIDFAVARFFVGEKSDRAGGILNLGKVHFGGEGDGCVKSVTGASEESAGGFDGESAHPTCET